MNFCFPCYGKLFYKAEKADAGYFQNPSFMRQNSVVTTSTVSAFSYRSANRPLWKEATSTIRFQVIFSENCLSPSVHQSISDQSKKSARIFINSRINTKMMLGLTILLPFSIIRPAPM